MGVAAYNRGSKVAARACADTDRHAAFVTMDDLNALSKAPGAPRPFGPILLVAGHGGWWATCPTTGFGFWHRTLRDAVRAYAVDVVSVDARGWTCVPRASEADRKAGA